MSKSATEILNAILIDAMKSKRSAQLEIGPSELGSCSRQMYYKLNGQKATNATLQMPSIFGTAIHSHIQKIVDKHDKDRYLTEIEVEYEGMKGHIDVYDRTEMEVLDWKSTTKKNQSYFPTKSQLWQVHVYGYLLEKNNKPVNKVTLISLARDGTENDIKVHSEPYNEAIALEGLKWLRTIEEMTEPPAPEKIVQFCAYYCPYYDQSGKVGCMGKEADLRDLPTIEDEMLIQAVKDYLLYSQKIKELEQKQDMAKYILEGTVGQTPDGIKVLWKEVAGRTSIDESEVFNKLGYVPKKTGNPSWRLTIK